MVNCIIHVLVSKSFMHAIKMTCAGVLVIHNHPKSSPFNATSAVSNAVSVRAPPIAISAVEAAKAGASLTPSQIRQHFRIQMLVF